MQKDDEEEVKSKPLILVQSFLIETRSVSVLNLETLSVRLGLLSVVDKIIILFEFQKKQS